MSEREKPRDDMPLQSQDYGGEGFTVADPEGHIWSFGDYDPWN